MWRKVVADVETLPNYFLYCDELADGDERMSFEISEWQNDLVAFVEYIMSQVSIITYNGVDFDNQVIQYIIDTAEYWEKHDYTGLEIAQDIKKFASKIIALKHDKQFLPYYPGKCKVPCLDLFKMNHWDNPAKQSSLKWLEFTCCYPNLEEMNIPHDQPILESQRELIKSYCFNDIGATKVIFKKSVEHIDLRKKIGAKFNLDLLNASEPRIAREMLAKFLSEDMAIPVKELKKLRTFRGHIALKDCILPNIKFKDERLKNLLSKFKSVTIDSQKVKEGFKESVEFKNVKIDYGVGGIHGFFRPGKYTSDEKYIIKTVDVTSFYPNLMMIYDFKPAHLGKSFGKRFKWFYEERKTYDKKNPLNYCYKIILNSAYGQTQSKDSFLYDTKTTLQVTVNGQLFLTMLAESLASIPESQILMMNTDGLEIRMPREHEELYNKLCKDWEEHTQMPLEYNEYKAMWARDCNHYIAQFMNGETKCKGDYEFKDMMEGKLSSLHKNRSALVVPMAVYEHFVNGKNIVDVIQNHTNIHDFYIGKKAKQTGGRHWWYEARYDVDNEIKIDKLQKVIRYYVSTKGKKILKMCDDGREFQTEAGKWRQVITNKHEDKPMEKYNIDFIYYFSKAYDLIQAIPIPKNPDFIKPAIYKKQELF